MADRLMLEKYDPKTGEILYRGSVDLGGGRSLSFNVEGNDGHTTGDPWVRLKFDSYCATSIEAAMLRMADWLEAAARPFRGVVEYGPPKTFTTVARAKGTAQATFDTGSEGEP